MFFIFPIGEKREKPFRPFPTLLNDPSFPRDIYNDQHSPSSLLHLDQVTRQILNNDTVLSLFTRESLSLLSTPSTFTRLLLPFLCRIQQKTLEQV
jgi:hypothetical protein